MITPSPPALTRCSLGAGPTRTLYADSADIGRLREPVNEGVEHAGTCVGA